MNKSRHQSGNDRNDSDHRRTDTADHSAEGSECRLCTCNNSREIGDKLHQLADTDHRFSDYDKERSECSCHKSDLDNGFLCRRRQRIEFINKPLNTGNNGTNRRHQDFTERDSKLLQLRFQNGELTAEVVLHNSRHFLGHTVVAVHFI